MPTPLSRIEREYILKTLEDSLPAFTVLSGPRLIQIPESAYRCEQGKFTLSPEALTALGETHRSPLRFCFFHRQRGMFFDLPHDTFAKGNANFLLPEKVYLEDLSQEAVDVGSLSFAYGGVRFAAEATPDFPLNLVIPDPVRLRDKKNALAKIAAKAGLAGGAESAVYRLFEYLEAHSDRVVGARTEMGHFLFVDHRLAIASFADGGVSPRRFPPVGERICLQITMGKRDLEVDSRVLGSIAVRERLFVSAFSLESPKEEDKRFLFERLYREKYRLYGCLLYTSRYVRVHGFSICAAIPRKISVVRLFHSKGNARGTKKKRPSPGAFFIEQRESFPVDRNSVPALGVFLEHRDAVSLVVVDEAAVPILKRGEKGITAVLLVALVRSEGNVRA